MMKIKRIKWNEIEDVWQHQLWVGRESPIEPISCMSFMGGHKMYEATPRIFLGGFKDGLLVAVNSIHKTEEYLFRSRGLWVHPHNRKCGFGQAILEASCEEASLLGAHAIWTFPRQSSMPTYSKVGFIPTSEWINDGEFGPNCYAIKVLKCHSLTS